MQTGSIDALLSELQRLDARQCRTGYACGSTCISLAKECQKNPRASTGKQRLKRIAQLASGDLAEGKGLARLRRSEAAAKLEQLQSARAQRVQAALEERRQRRAPKPEPVSGDRPEASTPTAEEPTRRRSRKPGRDTPRGAAETVESSGDYEFARDSDVQNVGEDFAGSARHRRNQFRNLDEAEAAGKGKEYASRDSLLKDDPIDLISSITADNHLSHLAAHFMIKAFPKGPGDIDRYVLGLERRGDLLPGETQAEAAARTRRQYVDTFNEYRQVCLKAALNPDPRKAQVEVMQWVMGRVRALRGTHLEQIPGTMRMREVQTGRPDTYNPVANELVNTYNKLYKTGKTSITGQMNEFARLLKSDQGGDWSGGDRQKVLERSQEVATRIIEGTSMAAAFGATGDGKKRFSTADLYVGTARRVGGRPASDAPQQNSDWIMGQARFRGIQYGNSVTDEERRHHLKKAAEAMLDLADVLGLPDEAIGLNGTLGLAIGARGKGSAMAHYEPDLKVINLTRKNGVGTLAHEWGHALDFFLAGSSLKPLTDRTEQNYVWRRGREADPVKAAMEEVQASMRNSGYWDRMVAAVQEEKKRSLLNVSYWMAPTEMFARCFESYVHTKLSQSGRANTYLAAPPPHQFWPNEREAAEMVYEFDRLMQAVRDRHFAGAGPRRDSRAERLRRLMGEISPAWSRGYEDELGKVLQRGSAA